MKEANAPLFFDTLEELEAYQAAQAASAPASNNAPLFFDTLEELEAYQAAQAAPISDAEASDVDSREYDTLPTAITKAVKNVPERFATSAGGMLRLLGDDMSQGRDRYIADRARHAGLTSDDYNAIAQAIKVGVVDKTDSVPDAMSKIRKVGFSSTPAVGLPESLALSGKDLADRARSTTIPDNTEPGSAAHYVSAGVGAVAEMAPALALSLVKRDPRPALAVMSGQVGGQSYDKAREAGASVKDAQSYTLGSVAAEVIPSTIPLAVVLQRGGSWLAKALGSTVAEGVQETITEAANIGLDRGILNEQMTWGEAFARLKDAGIIGGIAGAGTGATVGAIDKSEQVYKNLTPGRQFARALDANVENTDVMLPAPESPTRNTLTLDKPGLRPMSELVEEAISRRRVPIEQPVPPMVSPSLTALSSTSEPKSEPEQAISISERNKRALQAFQEGRAWSDEDYIALRAEFEANQRQDKAEPKAATTLAPPAELVPAGDAEPATDDEAPTPLEIKGLQTVEAPIDHIFLSDDIPQFKSGADSKGVVDELGGTFDRRGVAPIQVWVRLDGRKEVISGRHRLDLARRSGEVSIPAQYHYERDGFSADDAATLDALLNIREGQGKVSDYVQFFKNSGITKEEADAQGILARQTGRRAYNVATKGSDSLISLLSTGAITEAAADGIASAAPNNEAHQSVGIKALQDGKPISVAINMVRAVQHIQSSGMSNGDLFGYDDSAIVEAERMAKRAARIQREIASDIASARGAAKNPEAARKLGVDVKDPEAVRAKIKELQATKDAWDNWPLYSELVAILRSDTDTAQPGLFTIPPAPPAQKSSPVERDLFSDQAEPEPEPEPEKKKNPAFTLTDEDRAISERHQKAREDAERAEKEQRKAKRKSKKSATSGDLLKSASSASARSDAPASDVLDVQSDAYVPMHRSDMPARRESIQLDGVSYKVPAMQRVEPIHHAVVNLIGRRTYYRHIKGSETLGTYSQSFGIVRTGAKNDVEVLAHEMAHYLDFFSNREGLPNFSGTYKQGVYRDEMISLSYPGIAERDTNTQMFEGFAEFVRLYLTNSEMAKKNAPKFYTQFKNLIAQHPDLQRKINKLRVMMHFYYYQGAIGRMEAGIGHYPAIGQRFDEWIYRRAARMRQAVIDSGEAYRRVELEITKSIGEVEASAWKQLRLARGGYREVADHFMNFGTLNWSGDQLVVTGKSLREVLAPINTVKLTHQHKRLAKDRVHLLMQYFKARRAVELHGQDRERQVNIKDARALIEIGNTYPEFDYIFDQFQAFNTRMLDFYEKSGLITKESRAKIAELNKSYVPFHRIREYLGGAKAPKGGLKRLTGGTANTEDILINIQDGIVENVRASMLAHAKRTLYRTIQSSDQGAVWAAKIPPRSKKIKLIEEELNNKIFKAFMEAGLPEGMFEELDLSKSPDLYHFWQHGLPPSMGDSANMIDSVMTSKGKTIYFEVRDPLLTEALQAFEPIQLNAVLKIMHGVKNVFTRSVTLGLEFMGANFVMDTTSAWTMTKSKGYIPFYHSMLGMYDYLTQNDAYQQFIRQGGGGSHLQAITRHGSSRRSVGVHGFSHMSIPDHILSIIDKVGAASEYGTRIAEAKQLRKEGVKPRDAAFAGRQISGDYSVIGASAFFVKFARSVHFFNATIQSLDRLYLELKTQRLGGNVQNFIVRSALGVMIPTIMLYLFNRDDETFKNEPAHKRLKNWYIPIGTHDNGATRYFLIPRPYDAGHLFGSLPEIVIERMFFDSYDDRAVHDFWWTVGNMFSLDPTPSIFLGAGDILKNKDWKGAPVVNVQYQDLEPSEQHDASTSELFYRFGQVTGLSPMKAEHMFASSTGYLGGYFLKVMDSLLWDETKSGEKITPQLESNPAITRFLTPEVRPYVRATNEFFELKAKSDQLYKTFAQNTKGPRIVTGRASEPGFKDDSMVTLTGSQLVGMTKEEKQVIYGLHSATTGLTSKLFGKDGLKGAELAILYNKALTGDEKRDQIDKLWKGRNEAITAAMDEMRSMVESAQAVAAKRLKKQGETNDE